MQVLASCTRAVRFLSWTTFDLRKGRLRLESPVATVLIAVVHEV